MYLKYERAQPKSLVEDSQGSQDSQDSLRLVFFVSNNVVSFLWGSNKLNSYPYFHTPLRSNAPGLAPHYNINSSYSEDMLDLTILTST